METSPEFITTDAAVAELCETARNRSQDRSSPAPHLLRKEPETAIALGTSIIDLRNGISYCRICHNISESDIRPICADSRRDRQTVMSVWWSKSGSDVITIEGTHEHRGVLPRAGEAPISP